MTFKDACNIKNNQTGKPGNVVHLSNLCTEITEVTSKEGAAICRNLGSVNLARHVMVDEAGVASFDFTKLAETVRIAVPMLDRVIDINYYTVPQASSANARMASDWPRHHGPAGCVLPDAAAVPIRLRLSSYRRRFRRRSTTRR